MNLASPWRDEDKEPPEFGDDGNWMQGRVSLQALEDISAPTWGETVLDMAASLMALAELGVKANLWTERDFIACKLRAQGVLDEDRARRQEEIQQGVGHALESQIQMVYAVACGWCSRAFGGEAEEYMVEVLRCAPGTLALSRDNPGTLMLRAVSNRFHGDPDDRKAALHSVIHDTFDRTPNFYESHITCLVLTPEEKLKSPDSLRFDNVLEEIKTAAEAKRQAEAAAEDPEEEDELT